MSDPNNAAPPAAVPDNPNTIQPELQPQPQPEIVSVNKTGAADNKLAKGLFFLVVGAVLVGILSWFAQNWVNKKKADLKTSSAPKSATDTAPLFNPEKTGTTAVKPKLGSESSPTPPSMAAAAAASGMQPGALREDGIRPLRGADGKVIVNPQGRAMGVDKEGNVVEVPPILAMTNDPAAKKPLPGQASGQMQGASSAPSVPPPSRYGGSLFVGEIAKPKAGTGSSGSAQPAPGSAEDQVQQVAELMRAAGLGPGGQPPRPGAVPPTASPSATPFFGQPPGATLNNPGDAQQGRPGTVGNALFSSATPVAVAKRFADQNLVLPKGRQADCILTGRIVDEVPGFTSCVLAQNLYSDNGRVLLLERGSELSGEYGITNQLGSERLFVTWQRVKTPEGIEVDLFSPGTDRLGTSGLPGHLDNRWGARIGAALLISFVKDITIAVINNQNKSTSGTSVNVQTSPGQNTVNASSSLAEEVIKQTIKTRPRLTINEGDRIAIYVARDLDFSPVYALKASGNAGIAKLLSR